MTFDHTLFKQLMRFYRVNKGCNQKIMLQAELTFLYFLIFKRYTGLYETLLSFLPQTNHHAHRAGLNTSLARLAKYIIHFANSQSIHATRLELNDNHSAISLEKDEDFKGYFENVHAWLNPSSRFVANTQLIGVICLVILAISLGGLMHFGYFAAFSEWSIAKICLAFYHMLIESSPFAATLAAPIFSAAAYLSSYGLVTCAHALIMPNFEYAWNKPFVRFNRLKGFAFDLCEIYPHTKALNELDDRTFVGERIDRDCIKSDVLRDLLLAHQETSLIETGSMAIVRTVLNPASILIFGLKLSRLILCTIINVIAFNYDLSQESTIWTYYPKAIISTLIEAFIIPLEVIEPLLDIPFKFLQCAYYTTEEITGKSSSPIIEPIYLEDEFDLSGSPMKDFSSRLSANSSPAAHLRLQLRNSC